MIQVLLLALFVFAVNCGTLYDGIGTSSAFTGTYTRYNSILQGAGIVPGTINYQPASGGFVLADSIGGKTVTNYYQFQTPFPSSGVASKCPNLSGNQPTAQQAATTLNWGSNYGTTAFSGSGSCVGDSVCTVGSAIFATSSSSNSITYAFSRYDGSGCGCLPTYVCVPVPACYTGSFSVSGGGSIVTSPTASCPGIGANVFVQLSSPGASFTITASGGGVQVGYGLVGLEGPGSTDACSACQTAVFVCTPPGTGVDQYTLVPCSGSAGNQCDVTSTSTQLLWVLWDNPSYYGTCSNDASVTLYSSGASCCHYKYSGSFANSLTVNYVTDLWLSGSSVCQWEVSNGDTYTMTGTGSTTFPPAITCSNATTLKPINLAVLVEIGGTTTVQDVINIQNWLINLQYHLQISPQQVNMVLITYNPTGVTVQPPGGVVNTQELLQAVDSIGCCAGGGGSLTAVCCSGSTALQLTNAIKQAGTSLAALPSRPYVSNNILLITAGNFQESASQIESALSTAAGTLNSRTPSSGIPWSTMLNFDALYTGTSPNVVSTLNQVASANSNANIGNWYGGLNPTVGLQNQYDQISNNVWNRYGTADLNTNMAQIIGGLSASNGGRSCGSCCGDCTCGTICIHPDTCMQASCQNVTLSPGPNAPDPHNVGPLAPNSCCISAPYQCPGANAQNLCVGITCNPALNSCVQQNVVCAAANKCYSYACDPSTSNCIATPLFSDPNQCFSAYCTTSNTVAYKPSVTCPSVPCASVACQNSTGNCITTPFPSNPPQSCLVPTCNAATNQYSYGYPSSCTPTNPCLTQQCDPSGQCIQVPKCNPTSCNNYTCVNGNCVSNPCPPYKIVNGVPDECQPYQSCSVITGSAPLSTCIYGQTTCSVADSKCQSAYCNPSTGSCVTLNVCPAFSGGNKCQPLTVGGCVNGTPPTCNYGSVTCTASDSCHTSTCDPTSGRCTPGTLCQTTNNGNQCTTLDTTSCGSSGGCSYNAVTCSPNSNPCINSTCQPSSGCSYPVVCPMYNSSSNKCFVVDNTLCPNKCSYKAVVCPKPTDPCAYSYCQPNTGTCTNPIQICDPGNPCMQRDNTTCTQGYCSYINYTCNNPNAWTTSTCTYGSNNVPYCKNTTLCPTYKTVNGQINFCLFISGRINGICQYTNTSCTSADVTLPNSCYYATCNPSNGNCVAQPFCPNTTNLCNYQTCTPGSPPTCNAQVVNCGTSSDPCSGISCSPSTGTCATQTNSLCPLFQNINGVSSNQCFPRTQNNCSPCTYQNITCPSADPCQIGTCNPSNGQCSYSQVCPLFSNNNQCQPRQNNSCGGTCTYGTVKCTETAAQPCMTYQCNSGNGICQMVSDPTFTAAKCAPSTDPCLVPYVDPTQATCCSYQAKCPQGSNLCNVASCVAGTCVSNTTACSVNPDAFTQCLVTTGCNQNTGLCDYQAKKCTPPNVCQTSTCNNATGNCDNTDTSACLNACNGYVCTPAIVNCTYQDCFTNQNTGQPYCGPSSRTPAYCQQTGSECVVGFCNPINQLCGTQIINSTTCALNFGPAPTCFYWGTSPNFPGCCQLLPFCNTQVDPEFQCMLLTCNNNTNGLCALVDNSAAICSPYLAGPTGLPDLCSPLKTCVNATGFCEYDDLYTYCANQTAKINPCLDGTCLNGQCVSYNTSRCTDEQSPCYRTFCFEQNDFCSQYVCNDTAGGGNCFVNSTTNCPPLDNCTNQRCDPSSGCQQIPFNPLLCNNTDHCMVVVLNGSVEGCCTIVPKCPQSADPFCNPVTCTPNGGCLNGTYTDVCPPYQTDNNTGIVDYCMPLTGCSGICIYTPVACPNSNSSCYPYVCDPNYGTCNATDNCRKDQCIVSHCDLTLDTCVVDSDKDCVNDTCTASQCVPSLGCLVSSSVHTSDCNASVCQIAQLNPTKAGCCELMPKCVATSPCYNATCTSNGTCIYSPFCPTKKCADVSCLVDSNGNPSCNYSAKPCMSHDLCHVVQPCVEDGQPYVCNITNFCKPSGDRCINTTCDGSGTIARCINSSAVICNDNNGCTTDTCFNGKCVYTNCPSTDLCIPFVCNNTNSVNATPNDFCEPAAIKCDTSDLCKNTSCVNGTCVSEDIDCDDGDYCTVDSCNPSFGCVYSTLQCLWNNTCIYHHLGDADTAGEERTPCIQIACTGNATESDQWGCGPQQGQTGCDIYVCRNQICQYNETACTGILSTAAIVGATIGGGILAGIIIACIVAVACCGGAVYAVAAAAKDKNNASVMNNPLYASQSNKFENPLSKN